MVTAPRCSTMTPLDTSFLGKITEVHYTWRQKGWRSRQECWVSKSRRLDANDERLEGEGRDRA